MTHYRLDFLWSDYLVWSIVSAVIIYAWYVQKYPHLLSPWKLVVCNSRGMAAATVFLVFIVISCADSIHYRSELSVQDGKSVYSTELNSALDLILEPIKKNREKTYSAPFATHLFSKETVKNELGHDQRIFPRLRFGGTHLADPVADWLPDIFKKSLSGILMACVIWLFGFLVVLSVMSRLKKTPIKKLCASIWSDSSMSAFRAVCITIAIMLLIGVPLVYLASYYHVFGTDKVGQDVCYQALKSIRTGMVIGLLATIVTLPIAVLLGVMAGYLRGWVDDCIQYIYTTLSSIPSVLLIAASVLMMQVYIENHTELFPSAESRADIRLLALCVILGMTSWTGLCRLLRGESMRLRELEYIQAAHAIAVSDWRIMMQHILPNVMHIVIMALVMDFSGLVLAEAVLSYVGVGVDTSMMSFGTMINSARLEMAREPMVWWSLSVAFTFMLLLVLAANIFADAVREAFDPRLKAKVP